MKFYWQVFRLVFVIFSLYLMGDAFYRWDGFRYYATFSEFLPSAALATVLWNIVAVFTAFIIWLSVWALERFGLYIGKKINREHILIFWGIFMALGSAVWITKRHIMHYGIPLKEKLIVFLFFAFIVILLTRILHNKAEKIISIILSHITPLMWLFGIWAVLSVSILAYSIWLKPAERISPQKISDISLVDDNYPNIILITFDALAARDMSLYGYHRPTTPFIEKWAKEASVFTRLEAGGNFTLPTVTTLMTGKRVWSHHAYQHHARNSKIKLESFPSLLKSKGYYNMAFVQNSAAATSTLGITSSFDIAPVTSNFWKPVSLIGHIEKLLFQSFSDKIILHNWIMQGDFLFLGLLNIFSHDPAETEFPLENLFKGFLSAIDKIPPRPFFAWIHALPPHSPYLPSDPYTGMFGKSTELIETVEMERKRYDEFIRYCDDQFGDFINQLGKKDKFKNTVIILTADHGESFEHNYIGHGGEHLYEDVTHIPLIIKMPRQTKGKTINIMVGQVDIAPSILDLAKIPVPSWMEGSSLIPQIINDKPILPRKRFSMNFENNLSGDHIIITGTIAVREGDYKLIHYFNLNTEKSLLFNLKDDPKELVNLFDTESVIGQRLLTIIHENLKYVNRKIKKTE